MKKHIFFLFLIALATPLIVNTSALAGPRVNSSVVQEGYFVYGREALPTISKIPGLTVDHATPQGFEVWGPQGLGAWLQRNRLQAAPLQRMKLTEVNSYPSPEEVAQELKGIAQTYPQLSRLFSIGKSVKGRDLLVIKIAAHVEQDDSRPEFKFIANMHGDEIMGRELMMLLIKDLLSNYGKDAYITQLLDTAQIYILPSMNPDGAAASTRGNANSVDLNRNFPDFTTADNQNTIDGRAAETQAVMKWQATRKFVLSANFHGGAECVSYLWDTTKERHPKDQWIQSLALNYTKLAPYLWASTSFKNGITNGYDWYEVDGGMQDWSTYFYNDLQFTIELSQNKWPDPARIDYYYKQNRNALVNFIGQVHNVSRLKANWTGRGSLQTFRAR